MSEQIETVLDLSQSEAGLLPLAKEEVDLLALVRKLVTARANVIDAAGLNLDLRGTSGAVGRIEGDPKRLARAFGHLIDNAIAATPRGGRIPVSYTHLDVYKRQAIGSPPFSTAPIATSWCNSTRCRWMRRISWCSAIPILPF